LVWIWEIGRAGSAFWTKQRKRCWNRSSLRHRKRWRKSSGGMPSSRLSEPGHEVIVARARNVRLSEESRRKDDRSMPDPWPVGKNRRGTAGASCIPQSKNPGGSDGHPNASGTGACAHGLDQHSSRADEVVWRTAARLQPQDEPRTGPGAEPGVAECAPALLDEIESLSERIRGYNERVQEIAHESYSEAARLEQVKGVGTLIAIYVLTLEDPRRFRKSRDVSCYRGPTTGAHELGTERGATAHQHGRRPPSKNSNGAKCTSLWHTSCTAGRTAFPLQKTLREAAQRIDLSALLLCLSCYPEGLAYETKHATLR
jgi:hypothetical protein